MSLLTQVLFYIAAFSGCIVGGFLFANFMTRGLVWTFTKVRIFGQMKGWVVVKVHTVSRPYYRVGKRTGNVLRFTPRNSKGPNGEKLERLITLEKGVIQVNLGLDYIEVDEDTNNVLNIKDWKVVSGHDAETVSSLMTRIAMLPKRTGQKEAYILFAVILVLLVAVYCAWKLGKVQESVDALQFMYNATRSIPAEVGNLPA